jgi:hypothetical protein
MWTPGIASARAKRLMLRMLKLSPRSRVPVLKRDQANLLSFP